MFYDQKVFAKKNRQYYIQVKGKIKMNIPGESICKLTGQRCNTVAMCRNCKVYLESLKAK